MAQMVRDDRDRMVRQYHQLRRRDRGQEWRHQCLHSTAQELLVNLLPKGLAKPQVGMEGQSKVLLGIRAQLHGLVHRPPFSQLTCRDAAVCGLLALESWLVVGRMSRARLSLGRVLQHFRRAVAQRRDPR